MSKQTTFADILEKFHSTLTGGVDVSKSLLTLKFLTLEKTLTNN